MGDEDGLRVRTRYRATHWVSFVLYNPVKYNDPTGHVVACGETREAGACGGENGETRYNEEHEWNSRCQNGTGDYCPKYGEAAVFALLVISFPETVLHLIISCVTGNCSGNESTQPQELSNAIEYPSAPPGSKGTYQSPYGYPTDPTKAPAEGFEWRSEDPDSEPGSRQGNWYNEKTKEWFHYQPDSPSHGTHYDYYDPWGIEYRIFPDGSMEPKY